MYPTICVSLAHTASWFICLKPVRHTLRGLWGEPGWKAMEHWMVSDRTVGSNLGNMFGAGKQESPRSGYCKSNIKSGSLPP